MATPSILLLVTLLVAHSHQVPDLLPGVPFGWHSRTFRNLFRNSTEKSLFIGIFNVNALATRDYINDILSDPPGENFFHISSTTRVSPRLNTSRPIDPVILFANSRSAKGDVDSLLEQLPWTPTRVIVIITDNQVAISRQKELLSLLGTGKVYDVVALNMHDPRPNFMSYFPHQPPDTRFRLISEPKTLADLFEDKTRNYNKNELRIFQLDEPPYTRLNVDGSFFGANEFLFRILEEKLNATVIVTTSLLGVDLFNLPLIDALGFDLWLRTCEVQNNRVEQFTYPFTREVLQLMMLRKSITIASFLWNLLQETVWLFLLVLLVTFFILRWSFTGPPIITVTNYVDMVMRIILLASTPLYPNTGVAGIILVSVSFICLVYMTVVQSTVTSFLISRRQSQYDTIAQLMEDGYKVFLPPNFQVDAIPNHFVVEEEKWADMSQKSVSVFFNLYPKVVAPIWRGRFDILNYAVKDKLHLVQEEIRHSLLAYNMLPRAPLFGFINDLSFRVFEGGLRQYMELPVVTAMRIFPYLGAQDAVVSRQLDLPQLRIAVQLLMVGWIMAAVVFAFELGWQNKKVVAATKMLTRSLKCVRRT